MRSHVVPASMVMRSLEEHEREEWLLRERESELLGFFGSMLIHIHHEVMHLPHNLPSMLQGLANRLAGLEHRARKQSDIPPWAGEWFAEARTRLLEGLEACGRMRDIYDGARLLWRLPSGENALPPVDLHASLDALLGLTHGEWGRRARLEKDYAPGLHTVPVRQHPLSHVLFRLLLDALQLVPPGAPQRHVLGVRTRWYENRVLVTLSVTGPELPRDVLSRLFDPLYQPPLPGPDPWLDLSVSRALVEEMGGALSAEPLPGGGTTFSLVLPASERDRDETWRSADARPPWALQHDRRIAMRALVACLARTLRPFLTPLTHGVQFTRDRLEGMARDLGRSPFPEDEQFVLTLSNECLPACSRLGERLRDMRHLTARPSEPPVSLDFHTSLEAVLSPLRGELEPTIRLEKDYTSGPPHVLGSEGHLRLALTHLLRYSLHGLKHSSSPSRVLHLRTGYEEGRVRLDISPETRPSERASPSELLPFLDPFDFPEPLGGYFSPYLALPISEALLEAMGGELRVECQEGAGNTFTVLLPAG